MKLKAVNSALIWCVYDEDKPLGDSRVAEICHLENEEAGYLARLFAAAPELLEACKGVDILYAEFQSALAGIVGTPSFDLITEAVRKARSAIAKAKGEE